MITWFWEKLSPGWREKWHQISAPNDSPGTANSVFKQESSSPQRRSCDSHLYSKSYRSDYERDNLQRRDNWRDGSRDRFQGRSEDQRGRDPRQSSLRSRSNSPMNRRNNQNSRSPEDGRWSPSETGRYNVICYGCNRSGHYKNECLYKFEQEDKRGDLEKRDSVDRRSGDEKRRFQSPIFSKN